MSSLGPDAPGALRMIMVKGEAYMSSELFSRLPGVSALLDGKQWIHVAQSQLGESGGSAGQAGQTDPSGTIDALRGVSKDVTTVGKERVRNVDTTHYRADLDLEKAIAKLPAGRRGEVHKLMDQLGPTVPIDIWLDDHDLPRRVGLEIDSTVKDKAVHVSETLDFFDYGVHADVQAPPADQVLDMKDLLGKPVSSA